ncbi:hypothetical protein FKP32DRAFT_241557 [Trametes sanguinea]|nr:hypothetical protein FKP32DRAFT_241557 [Trametes sanguinea]
MHRWRVENWRRDRFGTPRARNCAYAWPGTSPVNPSTLAFMAIVHGSSRRHDTRALSGCPSPFRGGKTVDKDPATASVRWEREGFFRECSVSSLSRGESASERHKAAGESPAPDPACHSGSGRINRRCLGASVTLEQQDSASAHRRRKRCTSAAHLLHHAVLYSLFSRRQCHGHGPLIPSKSAVDVSRIACVHGSSSTNQS